MRGCTKGDGEEDGLLWKTQEFWETLDQAQISMIQHIEAHKLETPVVAALAAQAQEGGSRIPKGVLLKVEAHITNQKWSYFEGHGRGTKHIVA